MNVRTLIALLVGCLIALTACDREAYMSQQGFRLPDGDAEAGRKAFLYLQCHECHTIVGEELPELPGAPQPYVELGGKVASVKTYGDLVTSIINPSHRLATRYAEQVVADDGESKMHVYNTYMTVQQLIDIVMYLQPTYDVQAPEYHYRIYPLS